MNNVWKVVTVAVVLFPSLALAQAPKFVSEYSSLADKDCKTVEKVPDGGTEKCPSYGGYDVMIAGGEGTSALVLRSKGKDVILNAESLEAPKPVQWERPYVVGGVLEWRYQVAAGKKSLVGLIYRVGDQAWPGNQSLLLVIRATENAFCPLGVAKANEEARQLVDGGKSCPDKRTQPASH